MAKATIDPALIKSSVAELLQDGTYLLRIMRDAFAQAEEAARSPVGMYHVVVVPNDEQAEVHMVATPEEAVAILQPIYDQEEFQFFVFCGQRVTLTHKPSFMITPQKTLPIFTSAVFDGTADDGYLVPRPPKQAPPDPPTDDEEDAGYVAEEPANSEAAALLPPAMPAQPPAS